MKERKRKAILIVPPNSSGIRNIRVPAWVFILLAVLICLGFSGYFIPFNSFTLDVVEKNQKRNLDEQNIKLLSYIRPMRKFLDNLGEKVEGLERKKVKVSAMMGIGEAGHRGDVQADNLKASLLSLDQLTNLVIKNDALFSSVAESNKKGESSYFDDIPMIKPILDSALIAARFGMEKDPFTENNKMHLGIDFIASRGAPVVATASGIVAKVEEGRIWGRRIFINHGHGFSTVYAHLGTVEAFSGKKVKKGEQIGTAGLSGLTTGVHVHYELWRNGKPINPEEYFFPVLTFSK
jgi:murein DD-endopeptidase MepM/ murein hydrolase activator NlpD